MSLLSFLKHIFGFLTRQKGKGGRKQMVSRNRRIQNIMHHKRLHDYERQQAASVVSDVGNQQKVRHTVLPTSQGVSQKETQGSEDWKQRVGGRIKRIRKRIRGSKKRVRSLSVSGR